MINVEHEGKDTFLVTVKEDGRTTQHTVTVSDSYHRRVTGGATGKEELIRRSFEFLLTREPQEAILSRFDLPVIQRYFPEYEKHIRENL